MTIALVHNNKAFLPALYGYTRFFASLGIRCEAVTPRDLPSLDRRVDWHFMGLDRVPRQEGIYKIHEYLSPSTPPFRKLKDAGKRLLNTTPDLRIFKNEYVQKRFGFSDGVPCCFQEIGIADEWFLPAGESYDKEFDFIYIGDLSANRKPELLLNRFTQPGLRDHTLLLLSRDYARLQQQYAGFPNIIFRGPVEKSAVKNYILRSRYGINYIPDKEPYNQLTSTKFLEYAACGIPIISTNYAWVQDFRRQYGGRYLFLSPGVADLNWDKVTGFDYSTPDMGAWTWERQIRKSGVLEFLSKKFPEVKL
jgi:glycosyltransferase involved in cell wall biosynthesis